MHPAPELLACSVGTGRALLAWAQLGLGLLVPDLEEGVPGACGYSHAIVSDPETAYTAVVASENTWGGRGVSEPSRPVPLSLPAPPAQLPTPPARSPFMASQMLQLKSS